MRLAVWTALAFGLSLALPHQAAGQPSTVREPAALRAESLMVEAMGGRRAWERARFFDFIWAVERGTRVVERRHIWDRWTGRYKLIAPLGEGQEMVAVFDANTKAGDVWVNGRKIAGDSATALLDRAHAIYINDAYWFVMPFKWLDPGVNLRHLGTVTDSAGQRWEKIELTFEGVGRTPENRYHAYLDPETHLMGWWEHFRRRDDTEVNARSLWTQWERRGPIKVSLNRPFIGSEGRIYFPRAIIATEVDESVFAPPARR